MWIWESEKAKAVVVIVHGAGEHHGRYEWLKSQWVSNGFHVVMGDLPGQGTTRRKRGHIDSFNVYIEAIESWVLKAQEFNLPVILFGHSMGGLAVIRALTEKQLNVNALVLSSPCLGIIHKPSITMSTISKLMNKVYPGLLISADQGLSNGTRSEEIRKRDAEDALLVKKVSVRWYRELVTAIKRAHQSTDQFPEIPVILVQAGNDLIVDKWKVREWFDNLPIMEKSFKEWPDLYHEVLNEPERDQVFHYLNHLIKLHVK
ncbi:alpha/beta hydrolase [Pseudalkalibacillus decolorationis]|uniref:alpha/beta hydrolase n=1 Tax=Pseudalkalibacillus decolorationis TaxID=163879 RepID=UPI002147E87A|nr:alpha/beta hydrolase [Pseudalkalibacillus decolorationis]